MLSLALVFLSLALVAGGPMFIVLVFVIDGIDVC